MCVIVDTGVVGCLLWSDACYLVSITLILCYMVYACCIQGKLCCVPSAKQIAANPLSSHEGPGLRQVQALILPLMQR